MTFRPWKYNGNPTGGGMLSAGAIARTYFQAVTERAEGEKHLLSQTKVTDWPHSKKWSGQPEHGTNDDATASGERQGAT